MPLRNALFRQTLYPAPAISVGEAPAPLQEVSLALPSGETVVAWAFTAAEAPAGGGQALLVLHGNGENLETMRYSGLFDLLRELGVSFLAVDYPGYGRSSGQPSENANIAAAEAGLRWLGEEHPDDRLVVWGSSLGAAVAVQATARHPAVAGLITLSPWTSLRAIAREHFPAWLIRLALAETYDSVAAAPSIPCPTLVIHGLEDNIVPVSHGRSLAAALPRLSKWVEVPHAGHNDLLGHSIVWREIQEFLAALPSTDSGSPPSLEG